MKLFPLLGGGIVAGLIIVAGEAVLNLSVLASEWDNLFLRFGLPQPTPIAAAQGVVKLMVLGVFSVYLASTFKSSIGFPASAGIMSGLCIWLLVWAWVQWGMLLAGFVTTPIAIATIIWGAVELPLAACVGTWVFWRFGGRSR